MKKVAFQFIKLAVMIVIKDNKKNNLCSVMDLGNC